MESIKLTIRQLGRIRNSEIEITPWMIISGESGMGKSYLATLIHYFFEVLLNVNYMNTFIVSKNVDYNTMMPSFAESGTAFTLSKVDLEAWMSQDAIRYVGYMINDKNVMADISVQLPSSIPDMLECRYAKELSNMEGHTETYIKFALPNLTYRIKNAQIGISEESPFSYLLRYYLIKAIFGDHQALSNAFVLPPSRGAAVTARITPTTGMFEEFLAGKLYLESARSVELETSPVLISLMTKIMEGKVSIGENHQYRYTMETAEVGEDMPLTAAASSIRELAPIQMMIDNTDISHSVVLFEEPEAHLHPAKQRMMADVISCMSQAGTYMQITTHSDYLIRRMNELIMLQRIKSKSEKTYRRIETKLQACEELLPATNTLTAILLERQEDGSSKIITQDLKKGIPYSSFYTPLKDSINNMAVLVQSIEEEDEDAE